MVNNPIIPKINALKDTHAEEEYPDFQDLQIRGFRRTGCFGQAFQTGWISTTRIVITALDTFGNPGVKISSLNWGAIMFWMIRPAKISGNVPSRP
jgi:hypothetical protein